MDRNQTPPSGGAAKRRRFSEAERARHLAQWRRGGGSAAAYAREHGMSAASLYAWSSRECGGLPTPASGAGSPFVPVRLAASLAPAPDGAAGGAAGGLRIILRRGGLECEVAGGARADAVALVAALGREVFDV